MHTIRTLLLTLLASLCLALPLSAADSKAPPPATQSKADYKDAFLQLALEKAKQYTAAGERAVEKAVDVVATEAPLAMREFLVWRAWKHGIAAFLPLALLAAFGWACTRAWRRASDSDSSDWLYGKAVALSIATLGSGVVSLVMLIGPNGRQSDLLSFVQVLVAPRIYVIEQVAGLLR